MKVMEGKILVLLVTDYKKKFKIKWRAIAQIHEVKPSGMDFVLRWKTPGLKKEKVDELSTRTYSRRLDTIYFYIRMC